MKKVWLGKFLDLKDDIPKRIRDKLSKDFGRQKLTPLEFTILENIYNAKLISGYDLIQNLNSHFAGTWKAQSGTIYPLLSKLKRKGLLDSKQKKSPIGPMVTLYFLTNEGEAILKTKVNKNFKDQVKFLENFLIELSNIYIQSFPATEWHEKKAEVQKLVENSLKSVIASISSDFNTENRCSKCGSEIDREDSNFCSFCGTPLNRSN